MKRSLRWTFLPFRMMVLAGMASIALGGCGGMSDSNNEPAWNISGTWRVYHEVSGTFNENGPDSFVISTSDTSLDGTSPQGQSLSGKVEKLSVSFSWEDDSSVKWSYTGHVGSDGATMSGTWTASNHTSGWWHAISSAASEFTVAGSWNLYLTTSGAETGPYAVSFTQAGKTIGGTAPNGQSLLGSASQLDLVFSFFGNGLDTVVYTGSATFSGDPPSGSSISGTWMGAASNGGSGTWRAVKN